MPEEFLYTMQRSRTFCHSPRVRALKLFSPARRVLLFLLVFGCATATSVPNPSFLRMIDAVAASPSIVSEGGSPSIRLEAGTPVKREIAGGETHSYIVALAAGQFMHLTAVQDNSWVVLTLRSPGGKVLAEVVHSPALWAVTRVMHIADATGDYVVDVQPYKRRPRAESM